VAIILAGKGTAIHCPLFLSSSSPPFQALFCPSAPTQRAQVAVHDVFINTVHETVAVEYTNQTPFFFLKTVFSCSVDFAINHRDSGESMPSCLIIALVCLSVFFVLITLSHIF
jgi:hypothetical protein